VIPSGRLTGFVGFGDNFDTQDDRGQIGHECQLPQSSLISNKMYWQPLTGAVESSNGQAVWKLWRFLPPPTDGLPRFLFQRSPQNKIPVEVGLSQ